MQREGSLVVTGLLFIKNETGWRRTASWAVLFNILHKNERLPTHRHFLTLVHDPEPTNQDVLLWLHWTWVCVSRSWNRPDLNCSHQLQPNETAWSRVEFVRLSQAFHNKPRFSEPPFKTRPLRKWPSNGQQSVKTRGKTGQKLGATRVHAMRCLNVTWAAEQVYVNHTVNVSQQ